MKGNTRSSLIVNIFMIIVVLVCLFPVLWMCAIAVKPVGEPVSGFNALTIGSPTLSNFSRLFELIPVMHNLFNSAFTTILGTITTLFFCALAGFAFAAFVVALIFIKRILKTSSLLMVLGKRWQTLL